uniref:D-isomer specific 2-hydroxyacid dehydrogenase n=1 Tax=Nannochloropsis gaditana (strain CCMP526) TaxID=1093141 RepID=I2CQU9_NANGC
MTVCFLRRPICTAFPSLTRRLPHGPPVYSRASLPTSFLAFPTLTTRVSALTFSTFSSSSSTPPSIPNTRLRRARRPHVPQRQEMRECRIAILGPHDTPHMEELKHLPPEAKVVAQGNSLQDFQSLDPSLLGSVDVLLLAPPAGRELLSSLWPSFTNLKWIHCIFAGVDHVLFPDLIHSSIPLTNARGLFSSSLAEYGVLAMSYFAKDLPRLLAQKAEKKWERYCVEELRGATLGIVGYGDIGQACGRLAKAFGMRVVALKRRPELGGKDGIADAVLGREKIDELIAQSDYLIVAAALTPDTRGIISAKELASAKPSLVIINMGRGPLLVEEDVIEALREGRVKGAAMDVFDTEPLPADHPYWEMPQVLLSPHNMDMTATFLFDSVRFFTENCQRFVKGGALRNLVDKKAGY